VTLTILDFSHRRYDQAGASLTAEVSAPYHGAGTRVVAVGHADRHPLVDAYIYVGTYEDAAELARAFTQAAVELRAAEGETDVQGPPVRPCDGACGPAPKADLSGSSPPNGVNGEPNPAPEGPPPLANRGEGS
jgi:hypothetical protein